MRLSQNGRGWHETNVKDDRGADRCYSAAEAKGEHDAASRQIGHQKEKKGVQMTGLLMMIPSGKANAISMRLLASLAGISERELRRTLASARINENEIICTCDSGYFVPETLEECRDYYKMRYSSAMTTLREIKPVRKKLKAAGVDVLALEGRKYGKKKQAEITAERHFCKRESKR